MIELTEEQRAAMAEVEREAEIECDPETELGVVRAHRTILLRILRDGEPHAASPSAAAESWPVRRAREAEVMARQNEAEFAGSTIPLGDTTVGNVVLRLTSAVVFLARDYIESAEKATLMRREWAALLRRAIANGPTKREVDRATFVHHALTTCAVCDESMRYVDAVWRGEQPYHKGCVPEPATGEGGTADGR